MLYILCTLRDRSILIQILLLQAPARAHDNESDPDLIKTYFIASLRNKRAPAAFANLEAARTRFNMSYKQNKKKN